MAPAFSLAVVLAFLLAVAQSVELTSSKGHFKFLLNGDLLAKAKAGYTPTAEVIPGTEMLMETSFLAGGSFHIAKSFESSCTVPYQTHSLAAGSCIMEEGVSYKFQLASADSCAGATIQYFYDDACTLYAGSSEVSLASQSCHASAEGKTFTALTCTKESADKSVASIETLADAAAPSAEPTAFPTAASAAVVTVVVTQTISGVSVDDYNSNKAAYDATLQQTIALSMDGVSPEDVTIDSVTASASSSVRALVHHQAFLRSLTTSGIVVTYTVRTTSFYTSEQLFAQLTAAVNDGSFNSNMQTIAASEGATGLETATAEEPVDVTPSSSGNDKKITKGAVAAIVIGVIFGVILIAIGIYFLIFGFGESASGANTSHTMVPVEL